MLKIVTIGLIAGIISGLFGAGGGLILVPAFVYFLFLKENTARATSVFAILPMVIVSGIFYYKGNYLDWSLGLKCAIGGMIGGYIGARILKKVSAQVLRISFVIFLLFASIRMII